MSVMLVIAASWIAADLVHCVATLGKAVTVTRKYVVISVAEDLGLAAVFAVTADASRQLWLYLATAFLVIAAVAVILAFGEQFTRTRALVASMVLADVTLIALLAGAADHLAH